MTSQMPKDNLDTIPEASYKPKKVSEAEEMMTIDIDYKATDGGITINGTKYLGEQTLPKPLARQILDLVAQYSEVKNKMYDPSQKIRNKNSYVTERAYLADPSEHQGNPRYSMEFGLLDPWQWQFVSEPEKARLRKLKTSMYGYVPTK